VSPDLRRDPISGRLVAVSAARGRRPGARREEQGLEPPTPDELETCPFCEGREGQTPPETFAVAARERGPDTPGWLVRVVPNLYPALERQEVVVSVPRHARSLAELTDEELDRVVLAWRERAEAAGRDGFGYLHALLNEGREAGASLPHSHTQLVWLREAPELVLRERTQRGACGVCELLERDDLVVGERDDLVALAHPAGRLPYETLIAPRRHEPDGFGSEGLETAIGLLAETVRRLHALEGPAPLNAWLHTASFSSDDGHWHLELLPRLTVFAGVELGAGIYVNSLPPEDAAAALREVSD
jgi:UDPglucose--hexose-1-phosphate uridylyltransferase